MIEEIVGCGVLTFREEGGELVVDGAIDFVTENNLFVFKSSVSREIDGFLRKNGIGLEILLYRIRNPTRIRSKVSLSR